MKSPSIPFLCAFLVCLSALAQDVAQQGSERSQLYTSPAPESPGGLKGHIVQPSDPIEEILAIPVSIPENVYRGTISGPRHDSFQFKGLPSGKYDLVVIYKHAFYEGLQLTPEKNTLRADDLSSINAIIQKSEPFFTKKVIHRVEGETGVGNLARCICTFVREKSSDMLAAKDHGGVPKDAFRRTYKLVMLKNVGIGWQVVRARDLYPVWMDAKGGLPAHHFTSTLSNIRVANELKDVGDLELNH